MKLNDVRWGPAVGGVLAVEVVMIAAAFGWVAIYSYLLNPGKSIEHYQQYAQVASPWVSLVVGIPAFYLVCRWVGSFSPSRAWLTAMGIYGIYLLLDVLLIGFAGGIGDLGLPFLAVNYPGKLLACHLGGKRAASRGVASPS